MVGVNAISKCEIRIANFTDLEFEAFRISNFAFRISSRSCYNANEEKPMLEFKKIESNRNASRAKVPGGWFVAITSKSGETLVFYPDPEHEWDGSSLD